jgi:dienelactone hydrolase
MIAALAVCSTWAFSQAQNPDPESVATEAVSQLAARHFSKVESRFDDRMQMGLPQDALSAVWDSILEQTGPFQGIVGTHLTEQPGMQIVFVTCQFKHALLDARIAVDSRGRIAGLHFVPSTAAPEAKEPWYAPAYAKPADFRESEVTVGSGEWKLPGTLTLPKGKGPFPAVVLVHGSGPHDQDESAGPNKPFKDLAWGLASQNIAVLRYVKRTKQYGAQSMQPGASFTVNDETIDDAEAAVALLAAQPAVNRNQIYVLGHSLGGMLAPRIAAGDQQVAGIIVLAGTARPLEVVLVDQLKYIASLPGGNSEAMKQQLETAEQAKAEIEGPTLKPDRMVNLVGAQIPGSYFLDLRNYHPAEAAAQLTIPILVLQGGRDYQVTQADYDLWKAALAKGPRATFKFYPGLTHLFMTGKGPGPASPQDYSVAGHVSGEVVQDIAQWVRNNGAGK